MTRATTTESSSTATTATNGSLSSPTNGSSSTHAESTTHAIMDCNATEASSLTSSVIATEASPKWLRRLEPRRLEEEDTSGLDCKFNGLFAFAVSNCIVLTDLSFDHSLPDSLVKFFDPHDIHINPTSCSVNGCNLTACCLFESNFSSSPNRKVFTLSCVDCVSEFGGWPRELPTRLLTDDLDKAMRDCCTKSAHPDIPPQIANESFLWGDKDDEMCVSSEQEGRHDIVYKYSANHCLPMLYSYTTCVFLCLFF